eukprot:Skav236551  [mRNA]  locus=scaffold1066:29468:34404:+ [translate_table: standard]
MIIASLRSRAPGSSQRWAGFQQKSRRCCVVAAMASGKLVVEVLSKGISRCGVSFLGSTAVLVVDKKWVEQLMVGDVITLVNPRAIWVEDEMQFQVQKEHGGYILIHHSLKRGRVAMAEIFSGLSGWNRGCQIFGTQVDLFVDLDKAVAQAAACQHQIPLVTPGQFIQRYLETGRYERCVIHGDCRDPEVWVCLGLANVGTILASPPCQPWCSVGTTKGLRSEDGQLLPMTGKWSGQLGVSMLIMENVPGFPKHDDYKAAMKEIESQGLILRIHGVHQIDRVMPVKRDRWLATFVQAGVQIPVERLYLAQGISFDNQSFRDVAKSPSLSDADAVHVNVTETERQKYEVSPDALPLLHDVSMAPFWVKQKINQLTVVHSYEQLNGIMASYGSQHLISEDLLKQKGLHTVLACDDQGIRMWSPWEFVSALGYDKGVVLPTCKEVAWQASGNGLSVAHAWLQLHKTHVYLGEMSPFMPVGTVSEQVASFQKSSIKLSTCKVISDGMFEMLKIVDCEQAVKKPRIECPPTVPFTVLDGKEDDSVITTKNWEIQPAFESVQDPRCIAVQGKEYQGGVVVLIHGQKHWAMFVNVAPNTKICKLMQAGLPHARSEHFVSFAMQGQTISWDSSFQCEAMQQIIFNPQSFEVSCVEKSLHIALRLVIDVTWTAKSMAAYAAVQLGCNPDVITVCAKESALCDDDFLMAYETVEYRLKFKACMPRYVEWAPSVTKVEDIGMHPVAINQQRWYVRHPAKKVVRTVVADVNMTVLGLMQALFPDLHALSGWKVFDSVDEVPCESFVNAWDSLSIQWEGFRPFRLSEMRCVKMPRPADNPVCQLQNAQESKSLCIRSPFQAKTKQLKLGADVRIGEVAASFLLGTQVVTNMICMKGAVVVDPETTVGSCLDDGVYSFRLCPMLGGGKFEHTRSRLKNMLADKGVPQDKVIDRVNAFASKVSLDQLNHVKDASDEGFWNAVKSLATDVKYRLITAAELKQHQATMRQKGGKGDSKSTSAEPRAS